VPGRRVTGFGLVGGVVSVSAEVLINVCDGVEVDGVTDGSYLWLVLDNSAGRRLFHRADGYTTLLDSIASWEAFRSVRPGRRNHSRLRVILSNICFVVMR
jgi:hypothetical protein